MKKYVTLGEVCSKGSSNIAQKDIEQNNGSYGIYGASGYIKDVDFYHQDKPYIAVVKDGAGIGRTMLLPAKTSVIGTMQYLIPNDLVSVNYLYYAVTYMNLAKYFTGATIPHIYFRDYQKERLPLLAITEQQRIADNLSKIDKLIELCYSIVDKLDMLVKSRFVEMFGDLANPECQWDSFKLVEACANVDDIKCGPFGTQLNKDEYMSSGIAVWEIPQINSSFQTKPTHFISQDKAEQLQSYSIIAGDIAMSRKGNVGKCAVFPKTFSNGIIHSDVLRIRLDSKRVNPVFMMCQLHYSRDVQRQIDLVSSGAIMAGINVTKLKQIFIRIPPFQLQEQFAAFVEQTDKSKLAVKQVLEKAETLKKALMQEYFG